MQEQTKFSWAVAAVGAAIALILCLLAVPRLVEGAGIREVRALEIRTILENPGTPTQYQAASRQLARTLSWDGDGLIRQAEMLAVGAGHDAAGLSAARDLVLAGLRQAPLNPRGWTLLCELDFGTPAATHCMETGFFMAPFDWFTARRRAVLAGHLLPQLTPELQRAAARRVRQMWDSDQWSDHRARNAVYDVYNTPNGPALLQAGFQDDKEERRSLNRWLLRHRMYTPEQAGLR